MDELTTSGMRVGFGDAMGAEMKEEVMGRALIISMASHLSVDGKLAAEL